MTQIVALSYRAETMDDKTRGPVRRSAPALAALVVVLGAALVACTGGGGGGDGDTGAAPEPAAGAASEPSASGSPDGPVVLLPGEPGEAAATATAVPELPESGFNHSDVAFVQMMIPHHAQALEMARLAAKHAVDPGVRRMAARVRAAQGPEIVMMSSWLADRNLDVPARDDDPREFDHGAHGHDPMTGMLTEQQLARLAAARGERFDRLFLRGMIAHHRGALEMATTAGSSGENVTVAELAGDIGATQLAEIARMEDLLS